LKLVNQPLGEFQVVRPHAGLQAELSIVRHSNNFFNRLELEDCQYGIEDLLTSNLHVGGDVCEDGWLEEVAVSKC
jgi:hypothetical protein